MIGLLLVEAARAQGCACSIGAGNSAVLPMGRVPSTGDVAVAVDYALGQSGGDPWEGVVPATDRLGNSMPDMAMPGHLAHAVRAGVQVGLPSGFAASASIPYTYTVPLYPSDMPGDVPRGFVSDTSIGGRWGRRERGTFVGVGVAAALPTGRVVRGVGVRGGRGAIAAVFDTSALHLVSPIVGLGGRVGWTQSLYRSPIDGYTVGPQLDLAAGSRIWTREQGKVSLVSQAVWTHRGHDRRGGDVLVETGTEGLAIALGADCRVWSREARSVLVTLQGQAPVVQVVGDPWLAENGSVVAGVALGF